MAIPLSHLDPSLDRLAKKFEDEPKDWVLFAAEQAELIFKDRLFNDQGGKATDGTRLPRYSKGYLKYNEFGRKKVATYWDLSATHDLEKSIRQGKRGKDRIVIEYVDADQLDKVKSLEKRAGRTIFKYSKAELKEVIGRTLKEVKRDIDKMIKDSFK